MTSDNVTYTSIYGPIHTYYNIDNSISIKTYFLDPIGILFNDNHY